MGWWGLLATRGRSRRFGITACAARLVMTHGQM